MLKGVILTDYTDQGRRAIKDSPNRAEAAIAEAKKLGVRKDGAGHGCQKCDECDSNCYDDCS